MTHTVEQIIQELEKHPSLHESIAGVVKDTKQAFPAVEDRLRVVAIMLFASADLGGEQASDEAMKAIPDAVADVARHLTVDDQTTDNATVH